MNPSPPEEQKLAHGEVQFTRLSISLPCPVPVLPGTPETMREGEPVSLDERTEACAVDAFWMIGGQLTCDVHLRQACELLDIDYASLEEESGGPYTTEEKPWAERRRYDQESARKGEPWE